MQNQPPAWDNSAVLLALDQDFQIVRSARAVPEEIKHQYFLIFQDHFAMVDPDRPIDSAPLGDRLVFCGIAPNNAVLVFEHKGQLDQFHAIVFWLDRRKHVHTQNLAGQTINIEIPGKAWMVTVAPSSSRDLISLRRATEEHNFLHWTPIIY